MAEEDLHLYPLFPTATGNMLFRPVYPDSPMPHYVSAEQLAALAGDVSLPDVNPDIGTFQGITVDGKGRVTAAVARGYISANQTITLAGDFTGSGETSITGTLAIVNSDVGTFQGITVNDKGLVTAAADQGYARRIGATFSGKLNTVASATVIAGLNVPHGTAPDSPLNGDTWTTTAGLFVRINGTTVGPLGASGGSGGLSGMSAGQIPIAATATTVTSSANLSGDITSNSTLVTTLATVNANVGTFQGITVNGKGLVTAAADQGYAQKIGATFTGKINTLASATGGAGLTIPHGAAPTSPVNGDTWTTTAGLFVRINGATVGPLGASSSGLSGMTAGQIPIAASGTTITSSANLSGDITSNSTLVTTLATVNGNVGSFQGITVNAKGLVTAAADQAYAQKAGATFTGELITLASATGTAGFNLPHGAAPTSPVNGDTWTTTAGLFARINGATVGPFGASSSGLSGMTAGQIPIAATATTITSSGNLSGDLTTSGSLATTLATVNGNVGSFQGITVNAKGLVTAAANQSYAPLGGATFTGKVNTLASATGGAGLGLPHGAAPTAPVNGDLWTTTTGLFVRINGATVGPFAASGTGLSGMTAGQIPIAATATTITSSGNLSGDLTTTGSLATTLATVNSNVGTFQGITVNGKGLVTAAVDQVYAQKAGATFTGELITVASATGTAGFNLPHGAAPTSPVNGDTWTTTAGLFARINGATVGPFGASSSGLSGMSAGQIPIAASGTTITSSANLSGDITSNSSLATTLATVNSNVGTFQGITVNGKGLVTAAANQSYLTSATAASTYLPLSGGTVTGSLAVANTNVGTIKVQDTSSVVAGVGGTLALQANNGTPAQVTYAGVRAYVTDATAGNEAGDIHFQVRTSGALNDPVSIESTGRMVTKASSVFASGFNLPHGAAPTTPSNGDAWTTTTGLFARINGATVGPYSSIPTGSTGDILYYSGGWTAQRPRWGISSFAPGVPGASALLLMHRAAKAITIPINFGAYLSMQSQAGGSTNATASTVVTVAKAATATPNTFTTVGTITFAAGSVTPTFATTGGTTISLAQGDVLRLTAPASPDATFADFYCTLVGFET